MTNWQIFRETTNGVKHVIYRHCYPNGVCSVILKADDTAGVTLVINGYVFKCKSVTAAKVESDERVRTNRGIYWSYT